MSDDGQAVDLVRQSSAAEGLVTYTATLADESEQTVVVAQTLATDSVPAGAEVISEPVVRPSDDGVEETSVVRAAPLDPDDLTPIIAWTKAASGIVTVATPEGTELQSVSGTSDEYELLESAPDSLAVQTLSSDVQLAVSTTDASGAEGTFALTDPDDGEEEGDYGPDGAGGVALASGGFEFRYQTFIPDYRIPLPKVLGVSVCDPTHSDDSYNGNNRSWHLTSNLSNTSSKTRMNVRYYWNTKTFHELKYVGTTYQYRKDGNLRRSANAGTSGLTYSNRVGSATYARIRLNHSVKNPLCAVAGPITFYAIVDVYSNGSYVVTGNRVLVPNHELLIRSMNRSVYKSVNRATKESFHCLSTSLGCPAPDSFDFRGTFPL
ncbi:hypothetical protein [Cellulomonas uda]